MAQVTIAEPGELSRAQLDTAEALVRAAFGSNFRSYDWLHAIDGVHVTLTHDQSLVAFAAVVPRTLHYDGSELDTGYVEGVAVAANERGRGLGGVVMDHAEAIIRARHQLGALNAVDSAAAFYARRGWQPWIGHTQANSPAGIIDTYDPADRIYLLTAAAHTPPLNPTTVLMCDWRPGDLW